MSVEISIAQKFEFADQSIKKERENHGRCEVVYLDLSERKWNATNGDYGAQKIISNERPTIPFQRFLFGERAHLLNILTPFEDTGR